jgi:Flp pilus assembly pilin Flp
VLHRLKEHPRVAQGQAMVEYALIAALIAIALVGGLQSVNLAARLYFRAVEGSLLNW